MHQGKMTGYSRKHARDNNKAARDGYVVNALPRCLATFFHHHFTMTFLPLCIYNPLDEGRGIFTPNILYQASSSSAPS